MKRFSTVLLLFATLVIAAIIFVAVSQDAEPASNVNESSESNGTELPSAEIARPADATLSHIAFVYDGDTLYLQPEGTNSRADEIKVRLIGIDTPELRPAVECFGLEARDYLRRMLPEGTQVWVASDREARDQYGRSLLYLWTSDGASVNLDLVENGYATSLNIAPSNTYWQQFETSESAARAAGAGLWSACHS